MSSGVLFVVFGDHFHKMAMKTISYSRKFTDLPFYILTNIKDNDFNTISNTKHQYFEMASERNREIKTTMINYSPFEKTIYMDVDSVIQKKGIENVIENFNADIGLHVYGKWENNVPISYYKRAFTRTGTVCPVIIFYGAYIAFSKSEDSAKFFKKWNENWKISGIQREMPALAATVKQMPELNMSRLSLRQNIFAWKPNDQAIIQHEYGNGNTFWENFWRTKCISN